MKLSVGAKAAGIADNVVYTERRFGEYHFIRGKGKKTLKVGLVLSG
jgi:hypothetical protein